MFLQWSIIYSSLYCVLFVYALWAGTHCRYGSYHSRWWQKLLIQQKIWSKGVIAYGLVMYKIPSLIVGNPPHPHLLCRKIFLIKVIRCLSNGHPLELQNLFFLHSNEIFFPEHSHTPSGKKTVTGVQVVTASQVQSSGCRWQAISSITHCWAGPLEPELKCGSLARLGQKCNWEKGVGD